MQIGVVFPQTEIGASAPVVRDYARGVEAMGFRHILAYDHVLGASTATRPNWRGAYNSESPFHEVFVLFGYLAAITERVELVTGVLILPQRQTALVAKQAAEVDVLSSGRMRLGVGVGWNDVEYQGLNEDFHNRGARSEEQIAVLRALWAEPTITFEGRWHHIEAAGINPLPVRRAIPIWLGGSVDATLKRAAELGDGWMPQMPPNERAHDMMTHMREYARAAGRDPAALGIEARISVSQVRDEEGWKRFAEGWRQLGATHLSVNTMGVDLPSIEEHLATLRRVKDAIADVVGD